MAIARKPIFVALFNRLKNHAGLSALVKRYERKALTFDQVGKGEQPALMLVAGPQHANHTQQGIRTRWTLMAQVAIYARADEGSTPDDILLDIVDQVEKALEIQPGEVIVSGDFNTTLGGLVERAWIAGDVAFAPSAEGNQSVVYLDIEMMGPA